MAHREPMQPDVMIKALKEQNILNKKAIAQNRIKNSQLKTDIEKLLDYDSYCYSDITTDYDENLGYILDIKDNSYFYSSEQDRDNDDVVIGKLISHLCNY